MQLAGRQRPRLYGHAGIGPPRGLVVAAAKDEQLAAAVADVVVVSTTRCSSNVKGADKDGPRVRVKLAGRVGGKGGPAGVCGAGDGLEARAAAEVDHVVGDDRGVVGVGGGGDGGGPPAEGDGGELVQVDAGAGAREGVGRVQDGGDVGVVGVGLVQAAVLGAEAAGGPGGRVAKQRRRGRVRVKGLEGGDVGVVEGGDEGAEEGDEVGVRPGVLRHELGSLVGAEARHDGGRAPGRRAAAPGPPGGKQVGPQPRRPLGDEAPRAVDDGLERPARRGGALGPDHDGGVEQLGERQAVEGAAAGVGAQAGEVGEGPRVGGGEDGARRRGAGLEDGLGDGEGRRRGREYVVADLGGCVRGNSQG